MSIRDAKGYELVREETLEGIKSKGYLLKHKKSGARVLYIKNNDNNKVFSIARRLLTAQEFRIYWSIPCYAAQRTSRQRIRL